MELNFLHISSVIGAFLFARAVLLAKQKALKSARLYAAFACILAIFQVVINPASTLLNLAAVTCGSVGLAWLGLKFGTCLAARGSRSG